ncbi:amidophosphoribosyltransferase [Adhaeribacter arboris]|uniref:Amidophosphoribosyltransferase n=1 Tax=Adhaeribacter arboris TaxID=2072846 RepID=A0A2T2YGD8_9BACT|nr:amidophosphoribosyltransferase [Adhaeribacter arboris]PSR54528.1 amidophosphoribosyltransferase [Adhaeribacter arboris]
MSDAIKHECGIALIRLRKPTQYYVDKYGTAMYGINKLYLLMEKQHNRGQDGAGVASIKIDAEPGTEYISRYRSVKTRAIPAIFGKIGDSYTKLKKRFPEQVNDTKWLKKNLSFLGDVYLGHLRYGTHGLNSIDNCHPMVRENNWRSRSLAVAGNFNMTNADELFNVLVDIGQHPRQTTDTITVLEKIGHFLDEENQTLFDSYKQERYTNTEISHLIEENLNLQRVLRRACKDFDGGYAMAGLTGYGAAFVVRDPAGIRPAYYYIDEEVVVVASEKPAIKTAFGIDYSQIQEVTPGHALIINKNGGSRELEILAEAEKKSCSFERIYFSRGNDPEIYQERKRMGHLLCEQVLEAIDYDLKNTVFSYIPNTAETAWLGMMQGIEDYLRQYRKEAILKGASPEELDEILTAKPRAEKLVIKDAKMRTFITDNDNRDDLVAHVYDTTYEVIKKGVDTIVMIDDSIVRGTTLEKSIIRMLDRLEPKKIVVVSCAPQIRYPDCYGIDMSKLKEFVAFRAMLQLLEDNGQDYKLDEVYDKCRAHEGTEAFKRTNFVKELFDLFTPEQISNKVAEIVRGPEINAEIEVIFQTIENLHLACPNHTGDWYFTGNYPTPGGNKVVNRAFMNFMEKKEVRAY